MNKKGYTLIEFVIAIIVISIAFYAIIAVFISTTPKSVNVEDLARAKYLASRVLEETMAKGFQNISCAAAASFPAPFQNFRAETTVTFVTSAEPNIASPVETNYKKVDVKVWGGLAPTVEVITLVSTYEN